MGEESMERLWRALEPFDRLGRLYTVNIYLRGVPDSAEIEMAKSEDAERLTFTVGDLREVHAALSDMPVAPESLWDSVRRLIAPVSAHGENHEHYFAFDPKLEGVQRSCVTCGEVQEKPARKTALRNPSGSGRESGGNDGAMRAARKSIRRLQAMHGLRLPFIHGYLINELAAIIDEETAATELLEALKNIENDDGKMPPSAWKLIQDAIAKAEGESA